MPTCTSAGGASTRPTTSEPTSSNGAATSEYGSTQRWSGPTTSRTAWGTASPTKAIGPAAAVAAPHSNVTATAPHTLVRPGRTPRDLPRSSPIAKALSGRISSNAMTAPTATNGSTGSKTS